MFENKVIFHKSIKNLTDIDNRGHMIVENYEPKTKTKTENKKRDVSIWNRIKQHLLDYYLHPNAIVKLHESCERNKIDSIINKQTTENRGPINNIIHETNAERTKL